MAVDIGYRELTRSRCYENTGRSKSVAKKCPRNGEFFQEGESPHVGYEIGEAARTPSLKVPFSAAKPPPIPVAAEVTRLILTQLNPESPPHAPRLAPLAPDALDLRSRKKACL